MNIVAMLDVATYEAAWQYAKQANKKAVAYSVADVDWPHKNSELSAAIAHGIIPTYVIVMENEVH